MTDVYIYDHVRSPRGKGRADGALSEVTPVQLAAQMLRAVRERNQLDSSLIEDVLLGCVVPVGEQGGNIARVAALVAGFDHEVPGVQLNRYCGSGLEAVNFAAAKVGSGQIDMAIGGGVESMSRVPMGSDGGAMALDPQVAFKMHFTMQGVSADLLATLHGFSREQCDAYAVESQRRAAQAWTNGWFARSVVAVKDVLGLPLLSQDEAIRPGTTLESLAALKPAFLDMGTQYGFDGVALLKYPQLEAINHMHHAGNSSGIVDGTALMLIGSEAKGKELGLKPRARVVATAVTSTDPTIMLTGPAPATRKALAKAGLSIDDIDLFEVNEAFASVVMKFMKDMGVSEDKVNVNGGSIAMGHPLGATGCAILGTLLDELEKRNLRYGLATLCVGGGIGIATIIERV